MTDSKKVSDDISFVGQVTPEQLQQAAEDGFKSVLNLRSPNESGFLSDEEQRANAAGLKYANVPLKPSEPNQELTAAAIQELENLPKPVLIHCAGGARAGGIALIATAINEGLNYEQITQKAQEIGINLEQPHLQQFLVDKYIAKQVEES
jgi:uncharacterized protein (TIGR01244 family)